MCEQKPFVMENFKLSHGHEPSIVNAVGRMKDRGEVIISDFKLTNHCAVAAQKARGKILI